jgi:hypothetical protein
MAGDHGTRIVVLTLPDGTDVAYYETTDPATREAVLASPQFVQQLEQVGAAVVVALLVAWNYTQE